MNEEELLRTLLTTFRAEAAEHLQTLNQGLLKLERESDKGRRQAMLQEVFRAAHSLKGAARSVSFKEIEDITHHMENVLQRARSGTLDLDPAVCDVLYKTLDVISALLEGRETDQGRILALLEGLTATESHELTGAREKLSAALPSSVQETLPPPELAEAAEAEPAADAAAMNAASEETIRVALSKLDDLMAQAGELLTSKISAEQRAADMQSLRRRLNAWPKTWREIKMLIPRLNSAHNGANGSTNGTSQRLFALLTEHYEELQRLTRDFNTLNAALSRDTLRLSMVTSRLQQEVRRVRMVPFGSLELILQRAARDAARVENKLVTLRLEGGEVELDKKVLETLKDPLLHLLSNAISHGIEAPDARRAQGKPAEGSVTVSIRQRGGEAHITVADDGHGFDLEALGRAQGNRLAANAGTNGANGTGNGHYANGAAGDTADSNAEDLISLAFLPGVTTASEVTSIAGRGVGLDVVKRALESLQGRVTVENIPGQGAAIHLLVPVSLAMTRGLLVKVGEETYVLPLLSVEKIIEIKETFSVEGQRFITLDYRPLPLVSLSAVLQRPVPPAPERLLAVVMSVAEQRIALLVSDVLTEQELAVKPIGKPLVNVPNVAGAALLGNGEPVIVLNAADLMKSARNTRYDPALATSPANGQHSRNGQNGHHGLNGHNGHAGANGNGKAEVERHSILIVDDSITTRTLEKNILEAAGYEVTIATDGLNALRALKEHPVDLVVCDVEMPNMDGITFTRMVRDSSEYSHLPVILVTSLESREDRERGLMAGANVYIVKRGFDQAELLNSIESLL